MFRKRRDFLSFPSTTFQVSTVSAASALTAQKTHTVIRTSHDEIPQTYIYLRVKFMFLIRLKLECVDKFLQKSQNMKFHENLSGAIRAVACRRTDGGM